MAYQWKLLKTRGKVINKIHKLMGIIEEKERIQEERKLSIIHPIHKGEKLNCQNYRCIALIGTAYKTFTAILKNKLLCRKSNRIPGIFRPGHHQSIRFSK